MHALNFHWMPLRGHKNAHVTAPAFKEFSNLIFVSTTCKSYHCKCVRVCVCTQTSVYIRLLSHFPEHVYQDFFTLLQALVTSDLERKSRKSRWIQRKPKGQRLMGKWEVGEDKGPQTRGKSRNGMTIIFQSCYLRIACFHFVSDLLIRKKTGICRVSTKSTATSQLVHICFVVGVLERAWLVNLLNLPLKFPPKQRTRSVILEHN